jgi:cell division protein FtsB
LWAALGLVTAGLLYAAADQTAGLAPWHRLGVEVAQADARVRGAKARNARLATEIRDLQHDPQALEAAIREVIGWVKPGELRVHVEHLDPLPAARAGTSAP